MTIYDSSFWCLEKMKEKEVRTYCNIRRDIVRLPGLNYRNKEETLCETVLPLHLKNREKTFKEVLNNEE